MLSESKLVGTLWAKNLLPFIDRKCQQYEMCGHVTVKYSLQQILLNWTKAMPLPVGTEAPNFTAKDTKGNTVSLSDLKGKTVVLYFYPKDDTPGCTKQACSFRDAQPQYQSKDITVLGVSADDEASHQAFTQKFNLNFPLLVDTDKTLIKAYDVDGGGYAKRVTFVIDADGKISKIDDSVNTSTHAEDVLKSLGL